MNRPARHKPYKKDTRGKIGRIGIGLFSIVILASVGCYFFTFNKELYTDDAQVQQLLIPVNTRVSGYIGSVRYEDFQCVEKGDTLVVIDNSDYMVQKELAQAALLDAKAGRKVTASTISTVENGVHISEARIQELKARLWNAEKNYNRYTMLLRKESVTQQQFDQVKSDYDALKARLETLERSKEGSSLTVQEAKNKIQVSNASVKRAEAQLKVAQLNLKYTVITAPVSGFVGRKTITEGQLVRAGEQLTDIVDNGRKWITANFKEKQVSFIKEGDRVKLEVDGIPRTVLWGHVEAFASATGSVYSMVPVDNATGNFVKVQQRIPVRIEFDNHTDPKILTQLKAGMNVIVNVQKEK
ncbi:HlyD family secretion protein [Sinomicrobium sp. M5D2P17]